jgi:hypothetical protein
MATLNTFADLAFAAYGRFDLPEIRDSLSDAGFSRAQADRFARDWKVLDSFEHSNEPYATYDPVTAAFTGLQSNTNGLAVAVLQNLHTGERVLAIRGTDDPLDIATDVFSVALLGSPKYQGQYQSLKQKVDEWIAAGLLPSRFSVTGHSLGGFLATGLALEFPQRVEHAYLFNAPGLGGLTGRGTIDQLAWVYHITGGSYDPARFTSVRAKPGSSIIAGLGIQANAPILIESEDRGVGAGNHSIATLGDALAIYDVLEPLAACQRLRKVAGRIIRDASASALGKLEGALGRRCV